MIRLAVLTIAIASLTLVTGCTKTYSLQNDPFATPAYSGRERFQNWQRAIDIDWMEMNEDIDNDLLMTGNPSQMTEWNIQ